MRAKTSLLGLMFVPAMALSIDAQMAVANNMGCCVLPPNSPLGICTTSTLKICDKLGGGLQGVGTQTCDAVQGCVAGVGCASCVGGPDDGQLCQDSGECIDGDCLSVVAAGEVIGSGEDCFMTPYGAADYEFSGSPIPAGFFGPGSEPFDGLVFFKGEPIQTNPPGVLDGCDTIVRRLQSVELTVGNSVTIDIQMVALRLVGTIPVNFPGGIIEHWDVEVCLSEPVTQGVGQPIGEMTIIRSHEDGGTFFASIPVQPQFHFTNPTGNIELDLDCTVFPPEICGELVLQNEGANHWVILGGTHVDPADFNATTFSAGIAFDADCNGSFSGGENETTIGSSNFQPGLEPDGPNWKVNKEAENRLAGTGGQGKHDAFLNTPDDTDNNGIPDRCESPPDPHATVPGPGPNGTTVDFGSSAETPILPAGFFGLGSDPFGGIVGFQGQPIDFLRMGDTSTIVKRWFDPVLPEDPPGTSGSVGVEILELNLISTEPIVVTFNGGMNPEEWNVVMGLSDIRPPIGTLTATKTHANGGTLDIEFFIQPMLTFKRVSDDFEVPFDTADALSPIRLNATGAPFVHSVDPSLDIFTNPGAQFVPGVEETVPGDPSSQETRAMVAENASGGVRHVVIPPTPPGDIPAVSEWGLIVMTVLVLTAGTIVFSRWRRPVAA